MAWVGFSIFNREAPQITRTSIRAKLEVDFHFYYENRYKYHHHSEQIHNLVMCFAVFHIWIELIFIYSLEINIFELPNKMYKSSK